MVRTRSASPAPSVRVGVWSGVGSAIDREIGAGDVGGFGTGDEGYQSGDLIHSAVTIEGGDGLLRRSPVAGRGVQIGVDGAGLDVVDGDAAVADLAGQALGKHLDRALGG